MDSGTEPWNKWLAKTKNNKCWIKVRLTKEFEVAGFGFKSAGDSPERDPGMIKAFYKDKKKYYHIGDFYTKFERKRWHTIAFTGFHVKQRKFLFVLSSGWDFDLI